MYAINNGVRYSDINRIEVRGVHEVLLQGIDAELHGLIDIFCEDGFHLCTEDTASYARVISTGNALVLTDRPEPTPQPEPDPEPEYLEDEQGNKYEQIISGGTIKLKLVESYDGTTNY